MRDFHVHFSFYDEQYGNFDDAHYVITAETHFEAREKAWPVFDEDSGSIFRSNAKQYAVDWKPNMLDMQDYFNAQAASIKQSIGRIQNVHLPNDRINGTDRKQEYDNELRYNLGALDTIDYVAKDLYADKGMAPPSIFEELHYAEKLYDELGYSERTDALYVRLSKAKKWDSGAMLSLRDLFKHGYIFLNGESESFGEHFGRNGVYPVHNNLNESDYYYIHRWQNARKINRVERLPSLTESDAIPNSASLMDYEGQFLLLNSARVAKEYVKPENMVWKTKSPSEHDEDVKESELLVENPISGERVVCGKDDFIGVLRPDVLARYDFDALKKEYASIRGEVESGDLEDADDEFEM